MYVCMSLNNCNKKTKLLINLAKTVTNKMLP